MNQEHFQNQVKNIYKAVNELEKMFPGRPFTPDGHMVGSLGECLVADAYNLKLMPPGNEGYDAVTQKGKKVEIKATQSNNVAFRSCPEHTVIIKYMKMVRLASVLMAQAILYGTHLRAKKCQKMGNIKYL